MDGKDILHLQTRLAPGKSALGNRRMCGKEKYSARIPNGRDLWLLGCPVGSGWIKGARISG